MAHQHKIGYSVHKWLKIFNLCVSKTTKKLGKIKAIKLI